MRIDELVRELHERADETRSWPVPSFRRPGRRTRVRRAAGTVSVALASAAVVVLALVTVPGLVGQTRPTTPHGTTGTPTPSGAPSPHTAGTQAWTPVRCWKHQREGCDLPWQLRSGSLALISDPRGEGGSVPTHHRTARTRELAMRISRQHRDRWLLVGAHGSGPSSRLTVTVGGGPERSVPSGRPTLVRLPPSAAGSQVVVRERARPLPREILLIGVYLPAP